MKLSDFFLQPLHRAQHAFRKHYSIQEILHILRKLIEKAKEWQEQIFIGDGDVEKAYDNTEHEHIINALIADGCPKDLVASMARGWRSRVKFKIGGHITGGISKNALMQGDPSAPFCFNHALKQPVQLFWNFNFCQTNRYGGRIGRGNATDFHLGILLFADNFWIIKSRRTGDDVEQMV